MGSRRRFRAHVETNTEFELDLAPLLAVMVKLVPVLLISSAFVQLMVVETELPQLVKEAIVQQEEKTPTKILMEMMPEKGFVIYVTSPKEADKVYTVPMKNSSWDFAALHLQLRQLKQLHPDIFKIDFAPANKVTYQDLIRATDEARKSRDPQINFEVEDLKTKKKSHTDYMFPEVTFANMMEG